MSNYKIKSRQLSQEIRDHIEHDLIQDSFGDELADLKEKSFDLAIKAYNKIYCDKLQVAMSQVREGWLPRGKSFSVQFGTSSQGFQRLTLKEEVMFPYKDYAKNQALIVFDDDDEITREFWKLEKIEQYLKDKKRETRKAIKQVTYSCNTTRQLKEKWPEIKKYVEKHERVFEYESNIAPVLDDLNKKLNLNKENDNA